MRTHRLVAAVLLPTLVACAPGGMTFDAPSEDELRERIFQEPTAVLDAESLPWALEQVEHTIAFASSFLALALLYQDSLADAGLLSDTAALDPLSSLSAGLGVQEAALLSYSASGYIEFSCPGADLAAPDFEFTSGNARIQSPQIVLDGDVPKVEDGALFLMSFRDGCEVTGDELSGRMYGLFEDPWVFAADIGVDIGLGRTGVRADIGMAADRFTVILYDDNDDILRLIITHPNGEVTSARIDGANATCWLDIDRDLLTGAYVIGDTVPDCEF